MRYMLDTDICIYTIKRRPESVKWQFAQKKMAEICISAITYAELSFGVRNSSDPEKNRSALLSFTMYLGLAQFGAEAAEEYGEIRSYLQRRGELIGPMDMLLAAHAKSLGLILVTNNVQEFERVPGLMVENWVQ